MRWNGFGCVVVVLAAATAVHAAVGAPDPCVTDPLAGACVGQARPAGGDSRWTIWATGLVGAGLVCVVAWRAGTRALVTVAILAVVAVCVTGVLVDTGAGR